MINFYLTQKPQFYKYEPWFVSFPGCLKKKRGNRCIWVSHCRVFAHYCSRSSKNARKYAPTLLALEQNAPLICDSAQTFIKPPYQIIAVMVKHTTLERQFVRHVHKRCHFSACMHRGVQKQIPIFQMEPKQNFAQIYRAWPHSVSRSSSTTSWTESEPYQRESPMGSTSESCPGQSRYISNKWEGVWGRLPNSILIPGWGKGRRTFASFFCFNSVDVIKQIKSFYPQASSPKPKDFTALLL